MTTNEHIRTIEIEGQKFEVDLRSAKKVDVYRVGDRVKALIKNYSGYSTHPGVIVGIDAFKKLPTIVVAYMPDMLGSSGEIKFAYINSEAKDVEIAPMVEDDILPTRDTILSSFARAIATKQKEIDQLAEKREWFLRQYGSTFGSQTAEAAAQVSP